MEESEGVEETDIVLSLWKNSWRKNGWLPIVLTREDAKKHNLYEKILTKVIEFPTVNPKQYEIACFMRWVAIAAIGGGFMSDYDVINYHFLPIDIPSEVTVYHSLNPGLVGGNGAAFDDTLLSLILNNVTSANFKLVSDKLHYSDMYLFLQFPSMFHHVPISKLIGAEGWQNASLVHYYNSGLNHIMAPLYGCRCRWQFIASNKYPLYKAWMYFQHDDFTALMHRIALVVPRNIISRQHREQSNAHNFAVMDDKMAITTVGIVDWYILSPKDFILPWFNHVGLMRLLALYPNPQSHAYIIISCHDNHCSSCNASSLLQYPFLVSQASLRACMPITHKTLQQCIYHQLTHNQQNCTANSNLVVSRINIAEDLLTAAAVHVTSRDDYARLDAMQTRAFKVDLCQDHLL